MTQTKFVNCAFDPNSCPLLQGLSPEEQQARMKDDPLIRQCISHIGEKGKYPGRCSDLDPKLIRESKAYRKKAAASA